MAKDKEAVTKEKLAEAERASRFDDAIPLDDSKPGL
jgi:hypothetical protein